MPVKCAWIKREEGATAIEFAFLAFPFFIMLIAIIEISLLMANASILEGAANTAARLIRTGQIQQDADPEAMFQQALCNHARIMDCERIQYMVTPLNNFGEAQDFEPSFDEEGNMEDEDFEAGGSSDIVMIRISYMYRLLTPLVSEFFSDYPNNQRLLMSTVVFETEPYEFE